MKGQPLRLPPEPRHPLLGSEIDRSRPLRFTLNGLTVRGFAGDTVLSAVIASGITRAGWFETGEIGLDLRLAPVVVPVSQRREPGRGIPMDRMPAIDGAELVTIGRRRTGMVPGRIEARIDRMIRHRAVGLGLVLDNAVPGGPWEDLPVEEEIEADLVVIGGGLAGISAALYAGRAGDRVVLIERSPMLGGAAAYFGSVEEEEAPTVIIERGAAELASLANVQVFTRTEAFSLVETTVRGHRVIADVGAAHGRSIAIKGRAVVLATGALERLPIFPGNRLPGVMPALGLYALASRYGVWPGKRVAFATATNETYRLAMAADDAGRSVSKLADSRIQATSRFIEFTKAYGIAMSQGTVPLSAAPARAGGLVAQFGNVLTQLNQAPVEVECDLLAVSGGWQPDLELWHVAGGESRWDASLSRLVASGEVQDVVLVGAAAGYESHRGCLQSGAAAVARLFLRTDIAVSDPRIEAIYESADAPTPIAPFDADAEGDAFLDGGWSFTRRPKPRRRRFALPGWMPFLKPRWELADEDRVMSSSDIAAGVQLGAIPPADAGFVAQERCTLAGDLVVGAAKVPLLPVVAATSGSVPDYLVGRFGQRTQTQHIAAADGRRLGPGILLFSSADAARPDEAIGVVLETGDEAAGDLALFAHGRALAEATIFARELGAPVQVRLVGAVAAIP